MGVERLSQKIDEKPEKEQKVGRLPDLDGNAEKFLRSGRLLGGEQRLRGEHERRGQGEASDETKGSEAGPQTRHAATSRPRIFPASVRASEATRAGSSAEALRERESSSALAAPSFA